MDSNKLIGSYIVELFKWNTTKDIYEKKDDCTMTLTSDGSFEIKSNDKKYILLNIITDNFLIVSRNKHNLACMYNDDFTIDYEMCYDNNKFAIQFDSRSSASEKNFYDAFTKLRSEYKFSEYYPSGNIFIEGLKTASGYNGYCIEYYDKEHSPIKYMGEFEDGKYDGAGDFFSVDGVICISCKNICGGKPNGLGKLIIGRNKETKIIEMKNYNDINSNVDNYTNLIYSRIEPKYEEKLEYLHFESMSLSDRTIYLFNELNKLKKAEKPVPRTSYFNLF